MQELDFDYSALEVLPINKELLPYSFETQIGAQVFRFVLRYNALLDLYTFDLFHDEIPLVYGEPIHYGLPLFEDMRTALYPPLRILPWNIPRDINAVTYDNLGEDVRLYVSDELYELAESMREARI